MDSSANMGWRARLSQGWPVQLPGNPECFLRDYPVQTRVFPFARGARYCGLARSKAARRVWKTLVRRGTRITYTGSGNGPYHPFSSLCPDRKWHGVAHLHFRRAIQKGGLLRSRYRSLAIGRARTRVLMTRKADDME